ESVILWIIGCRNEMLRIDDKFRWAVPKAGFCWEDGPWVAAGREQPIPALLVEGKAAGLSRRSYAPLQQATALFREFAELPATQEAVLAFANEYGSLGVGSFFTAPTGPPEQQALGRVGEPLLRWSQEIARMKEALALLDLVRGRDEAGLSRLL